jgi:hypothetical protein
MKVTSIFLGACALASITGAVSGATINTAPIEHGSIGSDQLPTASIAFDPRDDGLPEAGLPEHYAMVTPQGRIDASELSDHGLYAQRRYGLREVSVIVPRAPDYPAPPPEPTEYAAPPSEPSQPLDLSAPADSVGSARLIDVAETLASRPS